MIMGAHQPNFFPWPGYFDKIWKSDVFVVLDNVQMTKTGSNWFSRVNFLINGEARFVSIPLSRPSGTTIINEAHIADPKWKKHLESTISSAYGRHPFYKETSGGVYDLINTATDNLGAFNLSVLQYFMKLFNLGESKLVLASDFKVQSTATQRLVDLTKLSGCNTYLEGAGAADYQEDHLFGENGLNVLKQNYVQPAYPQKGVEQFVGGLSILDALFNCGVEETRKMITDGKKGNR